MTKKSQIGNLGESIACEYLINKKFKIIERNFRKPWGELDIIAKSPDGILIFIEVKTMRQIRQAHCKQFGNSAIDNDYEKSFTNNPILLRYARNKTDSLDLSQINPEDNLTAAKLKKLQRTASLYVGNNPDIVDDKGWRIDLIAISLTNLLEVNSIKYFENI